MNHAFTLRPLSQRAVFLFAFVLSVAAFALFTKPASAAVCTFVGTGNFSTVANWDCGQVPDATSTAIIPNATTTNMSANATVLRLQIGTSNTSTAVLNTMGFTLAVHDSVTSTGTLTANGSSITVGNDMVFSGGGVFTANTSTVTFTTTTVGVPEHAILSDVAFAFYNLTVSSTQPTVASSTVAYTVGNEFRVHQGLFTVANSASLTVTGNTNVDPIGTLQVQNSSASFTANATTTNGGTIGPLTTGVVVFNDNVNSSGTIAGTAALASSITFGKQWTNSGTFTSGSSTVVFDGAVSTQNIPANTIFYNLTINKTSGKRASNAGNATTTGTFTISGGQFAFGSATMTALGNYNDVSGTGDSVSASVGTFLLAGSVNQSVTGPIVPYMIIDKPAGTVTCLTLCKAYVALHVKTGTLSSGSATITLQGTGTPFVIDGTFSPGTGGVQYTNTTSANVAPTVYNNLDFAPASGTPTYTMTASTTAVGTLAVNSASTLAVGANVFTVTGLITNSGLITESTGSIVHTAESTKITDSSGTEASSISSAGTLYVTVQDSNRNLNGASAETMTVTVSGNSAAGSDSETLTLTETGAATGIFRNSSAVNVVNSTVASLGNSQFEISGTGSGTLNYTDNQDSADLGSDTVTLTYTAATSNSNTGGGGLSSGGGGYIPSTPSYQVSVQNNLDNLKNIGVAVHSLVKLPDDKNASTQSDSAVYYVGSDGKRHAFPNDKVYFTWYQNFNGVQVINQTQLASITLGANVTYKPGVKMVKFTTDPKVYVVAKGGVLRWVKTEAAATALYGSMWNKNIDDISDAFYANYKFGNEVTGLADFNPTSVQASVAYPSDSLAM